MALGPYLTDKVASLRAEATQCDANITDAEQNIRKWRLQAEICRKMANYIAGQKDEAVRQAAGA